MPRSWIRIERGGASATLHALLHRVPRTREISLALAARLASQGVPLVVVE